MSPTILEVHTPPAGWLATDGRRFGCLDPLGPHGDRGNDARAAYVRVALRDDRLRLVAQPIVNLRTGAPEAEELLLRFERRTGELERPGPYLRAVDGSRLAVDLDSWVLERATCIAAPGRLVHMNLSARTVVEPGFAELIPTDAPELAFELTGRAFAAGATSASPVVGRITERAALALDGVGAGHDPFGSLLALPIGQLKLHRSLVGRLRLDDRARTVARSLADMAGRLGLRTVATGVEDAATLAAVERCGIDLAQGVHLAPPALA